MAESSLLGLVAAVSLPLVFTGAVRLAWPLWGAIGASVGGYLVVAATLGFLPAIGAMPKVMVAATALAGAAIWVGRIHWPQTCAEGGRVALSGIRTVVLRTATPVVYVILLGIFERLAGPSWAGLMSTFPSLSLVVLVVTYLEAGPGESSRVAQVLPCGNLSTLAFLAVFRLVCEGAGVGWATAAGYGAALRGASGDSAILESHGGCANERIADQPKPCAGADRVALRSGSGSLAQGTARSIAGGSRM